VPASRDVTRTKFAAFVRRALADAHDRGLTDNDIAAATGVGTSTFHRWQRAQFTTAPDLDKVRAFCAGLGIPARAAVLALGIHEPHERPTEPEPAIDPDLRIILRALSDPRVPERDKAIVREMLRMIADRWRRGKAAS